MNPIETIKDTYPYEQIHKDTSEIRDDYENYSCGFDPGGVKLLNGQEFLELPYKPIDTYGMSDEQLEAYEDFLNANQ